MANQINFTGLWIPESIILDKNLSDKEKLILAMIIFLSKNNNECTTSNQSFGTRFDISPNRVSKIISSLKDKNYISLNFSYKENSKEIIKRTIIPIGDYNNTPIVANDNNPCQKEQLPIGENNKVIKNNNYNNNKYYNFGKNNNRSKPSWQNYEQREYPEGFFNQFYVNIPKETVSTNTV